MLKVKQPWELACSEGQTQMNRTLHWEVKVVKLVWGVMKICVSRAKEHGSSSLILANLDFQGLWPMSMNEVDIFMTNCLVLGHTCNTQSAILC